MENQVFIVCLRQPRSSRDHREDPYWEVGSFGCTGCHEKNLLNPKAKHIPNGSRLAFAQGGPQGAKLVFLTPPVAVLSRKTRLEVKWKPSMPFRYTNAPLLIDEHGNTDFPKFISFIEGSESKRWRHKLSSKCRSRVRRLHVDVAEEIKKVFDQKLSTAAACMIAKTYLDAIPEWEPWETQSKAGHPWTPIERVKAYHNAYTVGIIKPRRCGKRDC